MKWYYRRGSQEVGPLETVDLKKLVNRGELGPNDLVWHTEAQGWMRVAEARKLLIGTASSQPEKAGDAKAEPPEEPAKKATEPAPEKPTATAATVPEETSAPAPDAGATDDPAETDSDTGDADAEAPAAEEPEEPKADVADLSAHRPDTAATAPEEGLPAANGGEQTDVTAGIVNRLRRRMEEITGEKMPTRSDMTVKPAEQPTPTPPPIAVAEEEGDTSAEDAQAPAESQQAERADDEPATKAAEPEKRRAALPPDIPTLPSRRSKSQKPAAEKADDAPANQPTETAENAKSAATPPTESKPEPASVAATRGATDKPTSPPPARQKEEKAKTAPAEAATEKQPQAKTAETEEPAATERAKPAEATGQSGDQKEAAKAKKAGDGEESAATAPSKQVAKPVQTKKVPPRELVADFRPPESTLDADKQQTRAKPDRLRSPKRVGSSRLRLRRAKERLERPQPDAETAPTARQQSEASSAESAADARSGAVSHQPDETPSKAPATNDANHAQPTGQERRAADPESAPTAEQPAAATRTSPRPERENGQSRRPRTSDDVGASASSDTAEDTAEAPSKRPAPHELAKAAAAALRRERSRANGKASNRVSQAAESDATPDETPSNEPIPIPVEAARRPSPGATVGRLVRSSPSDAIGGETPPGRAQGADFSHSAPPPGLRRPSSPAESSAVRSLPGRQSSTRQKSVKKTRRREGANVVPPVRQALSARNESARTRHLRGQYSLVRSYWGHLVLLTCVLAGAGAAGLWYLASNARIYPLVGLAAGLAVLILLIAPSQIRGVWRSANEHAKRKNGSIIARLAQGSLALFIAFYAAAFAALLVPAAAAALIILQGEDDRAFKVQVNSIGTIIQIDGQIDPGLTQLVDDTIRRSPRARTLVLNSGGGYLFEARKLRDLVEASPIRATYTRTGCRGACILPFMAGDERVAEVGSALQFGGPTGASGPLALVDERLGVATDRRYLAERGIDPERFDLEGFGGVNSSDRHVNLLDAEILTGVSVGNDVFDKDTVEDVSKSQVERALLTVPFFDTLQRIEPDLFAAFRDGVAAASIDSVETDGLGDRTFDSATPLIEHVKSSYLQVTPDRAADDLMVALMALGEELRPVNPSACVAVVSPTEGSLGQSVASFLDVERRSAFFQAFDQVIVMAEREPQPEIDGIGTIAFSTPVIEEVADGDSNIESYLASGDVGPLTAEQQCDAVLGYLRTLRAADLKDRAAAFKQFAVR